MLDIASAVDGILNYEWRGPESSRVSLAQDVATSRTLYHACKNAQVAVALRQGLQMFIFEFHQGPTQVYDLENNPDETRDIADQMERGEIL
ncbi:MAG: hypothetical protein R3284_06050 [Rubricoccaceae bacterium]|nr:hypothetical protein [Rubricoccaceae bacterium]